ncbi:hypothetical protein QYF36_018163 [Acer negundo]|nr:hypothetical protein QYF36_018163 [Acer negundo]
MEEIFVTERDVNHGEVSDNIQLNQLRYVALRCLPELISFCSKVKTPSSSQRGQKLLIMDHHELDNPPLFFNEKNLYKVEVSYCRAMKNLFPASFSRSDLLQLELIYVSNSGVEEIVAAKEEGAEAETTFVFPRMTYLSLYNLHDLRCFYQGVHNAKWPVLEYLEVYGCDKIEILLASEFPCLQENSQQGNSDLITTQQPLFLVQQVRDLSLLLT